MVVASVVGQGYLGFQVYKTYTTKDVSGLSIYAYIALTLGYLVWIFYGAFVTMQLDLPLIVGSIAGLLLAITIITGISMYGKQIWKL